MTDELIYKAGIKMWAHATTGKYSNENAAKITMAEVLRRWTRE